MNKRASNNQTNKSAQHKKADAEYAAQSAAFNAAEKELQARRDAGELITSTDKINAAVNADYADALKTEAEAAEAEAAEAEANTAEANTAEAEAAEAAEVMEISVSETEVAEAAEALKAEAAEALKTAEAGKSGKRSAEEIAAELKALKEKREKLAAEKAERLKVIAAEAEALKQEEELNAMRKELEAEELEAEALKNMSAEEYLKQSKAKELEHDVWESAFAEGNNKLAAEYQDKLFLAALAANGNSVEQIKTVREYWKKNSSNFRSINADNTMKGEKKQKAIMRRTLNRLIDSKRVLKDGMKLSINQNWKAEDNKSDK